jgi:hypothetical protein
MKFRTQHIAVKGRDGYNLHRDGNTTWRTSGMVGNNISHTTVHPSVAAAKRELGIVSSAS